MTSENAKPNASETPTADTASPDAAATRDSDSIPRRIIAPATVALTILAIIALALYWLVFPLGAVTTRDAYVQAHITRIAPRIVGNVVAVPVDDNQRVHKGDVLARIDARRYRTRVAKSQASLARRQAELREIRQHVTLQKAVIEQAVTQVATARAEVERTRQEYRRNRELVSRQAVSSRQLESAQAAYRKAKAQLERAQAGVNKAKQQLPVLRAQVSVQQKQIAATRAALRDSQIDLDDTVIRAPIDARVGQLGVSVGDFVNTGKPLMALVPLARLYVIANFKENQLTNVRAGQRVRVVVDAFPDRVLKARVGSLAPASNAVFSMIPPTNATGNFTEIPQRVPVKIVFTGDNAELARLRPGLSAEVTIDTGAPPTDTADGDGRDPTADVGVAGGLRLDEVARLSKISRSP